MSYQRYMRYLLSPKKFGNLQPNGSYTISAAWQSGLSNGSTIGQLPGLLLAGYLTERFGFRQTLVFTLVLIPCIILIQFFAPSLAVLEDCSATVISD